MAPHLASEIRPRGNDNREERQLAADPSLLDLEDKDVGIGASAMVGHGDHVPVRRPRQSTFLPYSMSKARVRAT